LKYLHIDKRIVHRDLNPANIMIDSSFQIKICDFGLAKTLSQTIPNNSFVGTLIYTCPEIVENKAYSEKADIWAVGCIVYELAKLKPPFVSTNPLTLAKRIVDGDYEKLERGNCEYSEELLKFVESCLTYEEQKRPNIF
jgi:serine/threonine protein kinase